MAVEGENLTPLNIGRRKSRWKFPRKNVGHWQRRASYRGRGWGNVRFICVGRDKHLCPRPKLDSLPPPPPPHSVGRPTQDKIFVEFKMAENTYQVFRILKMFIFSFYNKPLRGLNRLFRVSRRDGMRRRVLTDWGFTVNKHSIAPNGTVNTDVFVPNANVWLKMIVFPDFVSIARFGNSSRYHRCREVLKPFPRLCPYRQPYARATYASSNFVTRY